MKYNAWKVFIGIVLGAIIWMSFKSLPPNNWNDETPIYEVLNAFGEPLPDHAQEDAELQTIQRGYDLIHKGRTTRPDGKKSKFISKYYVCTSCHNQDREDPDLRIFSPDSRLNYVAEKQMKFLQGSTFYGIANRERWYNDDYYLKYGDLVKPANKSLAEATQLCATVCSSGRYLEDWELEAILAYYWDNQIKLGDLALSDSEKKLILTTEPSVKKEIVDMVKSKYALKSPAHFGSLPDDKQKGYNYEGDPQSGEKIYKFSCQACHQAEGVAGMVLDNSKLTFRKFKRNLTKEGDYNLYEMIRHGTYTEKGKPRYMPHYPKERMSDQQVEDLRAYIIQEAR